jgi:ABC-type transport system substrate-binding protein
VQDRFTNPEFNRLFPQQRAETDPARRATILRQMTQIFHDDAACAMTVWQDFPYAATRRIASIPINWDTSVPLWQVRKTA